MRYKEDEKKLWLEDWQQSGKSAWGYAKANGLNPQTFKKWTKAEMSEKFTEDVKPCFVEVPMQSIMPVKNIPEILIEKGDVRIHIPLSAGCNELCAVMEGLGRVL